jgi:hypothetical protein
MSCDFNLGYVDVKDIPSSTVIISPVTKEESLEASHNKTLATSSLVGI